MSLALVPDDILRLYEIHEWNHGLAVLSSDFPEEWSDLIEVLRNFRLNRSDVETGGGNKSRISKALDSAFYSKGWKEKSFDIEIRIDGRSIESPTHDIDCFKNKIMIEIEWSNKDPFFDRDLNNFRLLHSLRAGSVGVIITKSEDLKDKFKELNVYKKYGASTTWMSKLLPRIEGGGAGGCPVIVFGIGQSVFVDDVADIR